MAGIFSLRNWVMKQLMKTDKSGIMKIPPKGKIDFGEMLLREQLFNKGIDPRMIKNEKQLDNIINTPAVPKSERAKPKKPGKVIEVDFGNFPEKKAQGGPAGLSYLLAEDTNERMPYVFGGKVIGVLKNLLTKFKKSSGIPRGEKTLKPDKFAKNLMSEEDKLRLLQLETNYATSILEHLKADRQLFKQLQINQEMKDEGLDFLMKQFVDTQAPHMKNYKSLADMDQAILELETLVKNKTLKEGRQLNAEGGRIGLAAGGGLPPVTFYFNMQGGAGKKEENFLGIQGLTEKGYDYGGKLAADTTFPFLGGDLSVGGELGFGRDKSNVYYKGQPIDFLSNVGETKLGDNWNVGVKWRKKFAGGGMGRRAFLKLMAALGLTGVGAKYGLAGLLKGGKKQVAKELTQVPIKNIKGMPTWFKPLVNKVIKEGTEIPSGAERVIVHKTKLPNSKTDVYVNQDLNNGDVWVDLGVEKHGFPDGHLGQPVRLQYKASEALEGPFKKGQRTKTKEEFNVEEAEFSGGHPENVKFEESVIEKFGDHGSNFDEVELFATGKVKKK